jgi:RNA-binding protein
MDKREEAKALPVTMQIGKNLLTQGVISELKLQLSKKKMVKIKVLKAALGQLDRFELAEKMCSEANAEVVMLTGFVIVLRRKTNRS